MRCEGCARLAKAEENAKMYRRQLGGTNGALRREQQRAKDLELENEQLRRLLAGRYDRGGEQ